MKKLRYAALSISLWLGAMSLVGCGECKHEQWNEADCTTPRTCTECGETEGEPLGHTWKDATCETPKTCEVCGETEGDLADHSTHTGKCDYCGEYIIDEAFIPDCNDYMNVLMFNNMSTDFSHTIIDTEVSGTKGFNAYVSIPSSLRIDNIVSDNFDYVLHYYGTNQSNCLEQLYMYYELNNTSETDQLYQAMKNVMNDRYGNSLETHEVSGKELGLTWHDDKDMLSIDLVNGEDSVVVTLELLDFPF